MRFRNRDIDPKKLIYFAAVIEHGSFRKAARALNVTQPALSTSMSRFESELGLKLVRRGPLGVTLTPIGDLLYSHSRMIRDEIQLAGRNLFEASALESSTIKFGCIPSLSCNIVPAALAHWRESHSEPTLRVVDAVQFDLLNALLRHEIDLFVGFTENYNLLDGLRQRVLFRDRLWVVARPGHRLFSEEKLTLSSLAIYPWVFLPSGPFNMSYEDTLEKVGARLEEGSIVCDSIAMLKALIMCSDHLGLMPAHAIQNELEDRRLQQLPLTIPAFSRSIAVFMRAEHEFDKPSRDLIDAIQSKGIALAGGAV
ncbi:MAG: LysR family transcriptional regulator [Mesorhizobium sp.]|nr:MAG: LysR family transcriptional regulator [Mesorhizobium sp.]